MYLQPEIGYEAAVVQDLGQYRAQRDAKFQSTREQLRAMFIQAARGVMPTVLHVEQRATGSVVAPCPLAEVLPELFDHHDVHHALVDLLRDCRTLDAAALITKLAQRYADMQTPQIVALGGLVDERA